MTEDKMETDGHSPMVVGARVKVMTKKRAGASGCIVKVYPGKGPREVWPYYFRVRLDTGQHVEAIIRTLALSDPQPPTEAGGVE